VEVAAAPPDKIVERRAPAGTGILEVIRVGGRSVVSRAFAASPLRWLTPRNHGHAAWVFSSTFGGGLVDGDAIDVTVDVAAGATALLSTQASTKVYRSPDRGAHSHLRARVGESACLVLLPDPLVPFAGSKSVQRLECDLAATASLVLVDWLSSGRRARGERWQFDDVTSVIRVRQAQKLICHDAVTLRAADGSLADRLGRFDVLATVILVGPAAVEPAARLIEASAAAAPEKRASPIVVAAPIGDGALVRVAGTSVEQVGHAIRDVLQFVPSLLGDNPWARKW
jgi:urease accessory protein